MKKLRYLLLIGTLIFVLSGCNNITNSKQNDTNKNESDTAGTTDSKTEQTESEINPKPFSSRSANLDFIFSTESVGKVTITMKRSEWNQMLKNYDYFYKNENCVKFTKFEYEKDNVKWKLTKGGGIRLRGNTSRYRPQGKDSPTDETGHTMPNGDPKTGWSKDYYNYAKTCSDNDYRQSHFKVDFEEFLEDDDEQKLAGCMKGVALKRMDGSCTKEIFCYDLFHRYGIWTAPRASHTRVFFNFIEEDGSVTTVNYGVYEMFEEVNKQSLKARDKDENNSENAWKNSKGNLWKCAGGDLTNPNASIYCEDVRITEFDNAGNPKAFVWDSPTYDLKTNKDELSTAASEFRQFITELNALPDVTSTNYESSISEIKAFYEKWMDVEFFLKTYAVNILVGMDDDYWANANNYYLYFTDTPNSGRKVYLIPFDYDNTIGASIQGDHSKGTKEGIEQNPFEWGRGKNRPLMDKLLQVPEYRELFKEKLIEVSSADSEWNYEKCSQRWYQYWNMLDPYLYSPDLSNHICTKGHWDNVYKPIGYSLVNKDNNIYDYTRKCFLSYIRTITVDLNGGSLNGKTGTIELSDVSTTLIPVKDNHMFLGWTKTKNGSDFTEDFAEGVTYYAKWQNTSSFGQYEIFEVENSNVKGICIGIYGMPEEAYIRSLHINADLDDNPWTDGPLVSEIQDYQKSSVNKNIWVYPYTEAGKKYKIKLVWKNSSWGWIKNATPEIEITAKSGIGENKIDFGKNYKSSNESPYTVTNNILSWKYNPKVYAEGKELSSSNMPGEFIIALRGGGNNIWDWYGQISSKNYPLEQMNLITTWDQYFKSSSSWNKNTVDSLKGNKNLYLNIYYNIANSTYGDYMIQVLDDSYRENRYFEFK